MNIWTREDIEKILLQLNALGLPFEQYPFVLENREMKLLGRGGIGYVYEAEKKNRRKKYAIKVNGFKEKTISSEAFNTSMEHYKLLSIAKENIVKIYAYTELFVWLDEDTTVLRAEKAAGEEPGGALRLQFVLMEQETPVIAVDRFRKKEMARDALREYNEAEVLHLAADIGQVLLATHKDRVLHKDVKLENIFYSEKKKKYLLGDFDIAEEVKDGTSTVFSGTEGYAAPEVLALKWRHDATADIYSLGMVLYLLMNEFCFPESEKQFLVNREKQYTEGFIPSRPKHGSDGLWAIVEKMCMYDADDRYQHMEAALDDLKQLIYEEKIFYKERHRKAYVISGGILLFFGIWVTKMGEKMSLAAADISWLKLTLFSLAVILLVYGSELILKWETPFEKNDYLNGKFWRRITCIYAAFIWIGVLHLWEMDEPIMNGQNVVAKFFKILPLLAEKFDLIKTGVAGTLFCVFWTVREKLLFFFERTTQKMQDM